MNKGCGKRVKLSEFEKSTRARRGLMIVREVKTSPYKIVKTFAVDSKNYLGIKTVTVRNSKTHIRGYDILCQKRIKGKLVTKNRALFSDFLQLYQDGILDVNDIYCLDFFIWNAKLVLEGRFDIENSRPDVFYADFFEFRKIHHFTVDNLDTAIIFLKEIEAMTDISIPVGQQRLQCN